MTAPALVQYLWNYCNILRDEGLSFRLHAASARQDGDYVGRLGFLRILKAGLRCGAGWIV